MLRQLEREERAVAREELARRRQRLGARLLPTLAGAGEADLQAQQLVEGEPPARELALGLVARLVQSDECVLAARQLQLDGDPRRERVARARRGRQRLLHQAAQALHADVLRRGIDRGDPAELDASADRLLLHLELAVADTAA